MNIAAHFHKLDVISQRTKWKPTTTTLTDTGVRFTVPSDGTYLVNVRTPWQKARPTALVVKVEREGSSVALSSERSASDTIELQVTGMLMPGTYEVWAQAATANSDGNDIQVTLIKVA